MPPAGKSRKFDATFKLKVIKFARKINNLAASTEIETKDPGL